MLKSIIRGAFGFVIAVNFQQLYPCILILIDPPCTHTNGGSLHTLEINLGILLTSLNHRQTHKPSKVIKPWIYR